ncbi:MAG: ATP-binding cassette domain-containing protein [Paracoccaceae bacterium]
MSETLIETRGLWLNFGGQDALRDVNLSIKAGEIVTIVGPNGSGKSSLLKCLIGAATPDRGTVTRKPGLRIGYVPQKLQLDPVFPMPVDRFLRLAGGSRAERDSLAARLEITGVMRRQVAELSGGQMQRVLLAQALIGKPQLLILDEATGGLDQPAEANFYRLIEEVRGDLGCAILMVSHDLHVVMSASNRVLCLNGHICCEGAPSVVSNAPEYRELFGLGTEGTLALYRHEHDHGHDQGHDHGHDRGNDQGHDNE